MKVGKIASYVGSALLMVSCSGKAPKIGEEAVKEVVKEAPTAIQNVTPQKAVDKALNRIAQFGTGEEYYKAQKAANSFPIKKKALDESDAIFYWDSLANVKKVQIAYNSGYKMAKDSMAGIPFTRMEFKVPKPIALRNKLIFKTTKALRNKAQEEAAKYYTGAEMQAFRIREPRINQLSERTKVNHQTYLYDKIGTVLEQRHAYNKGIEDAKLH